jgi:2-polyprenyl-3-methyl-5-hydroxy-6-metoxy-1,4-benzoquinol methylase
MNENHDYYASNARAFFESTVDVDMTSTHGPFLQRLGPGSHILDAGCGSGRDAKAFASLGHVVTAFDASAELARLATEHCGFEVAVRSFHDVDEVAAYDGIWCCASLLHVPREEMPNTPARQWAALHAGGCMYARRVPSFAIWPTD